MARAPVAFMTFTEAAAGLEVDHVSATSVGGDAEVLSSVGTSTSRKVAEGNCSAGGGDEASANAVAGGGLPTGNTEGEGRVNSDRNLSVVREGQGTVVVASYDRTRAGVGRLKRRRRRLPSCIPVCRSTSS